MAYFAALFAAGFAGSFHCVGMCGGFACALGRDPRGHVASLLRQLLYNTGRLTTYCFLGGLAGAVGQMICTPRGSTVSVLGGSLDAAQRILAIIAGLMMIAVALQFFGLLQRFHRRSVPFHLDAFTGLMRGLLAAPGRAAPLAFGVFNGFLPCPLVYAFTAEAAGAANALQGVLVMVAFGLGTFPAMVLMGSIGRLLAPTWRQRGVWLAGSLILLIGLITLSRGILPLTGHMAHGVSGGFPA
jgi:uncharacterized protein